MQDNLPATHSEQAQTFSRNQLSTHVNQGAVAIEQERAIAEAQGQLILAKKFPRVLTSAHAELMESCCIKSFAEAAFYSVPNRGSGPSIRFAEEVARVYGNFQYGHRELSRGDGKSEVEVFAWDMEKNNRSIRQITVLHTVDTKNGPKILRDQADIDNKIANVASKQIRGRILALLPKWLVADAIEKCKLTLTGASTEPVSVRVRKMTQAFAKYGVNEKHLSDYLDHPLDDTTLDELVDLTGIFNALKEGAKASEYFSQRDDGAAAEASANTAAALKAAAGTVVHPHPLPTQRQRRTATQPPADTPAATEPPPAEQPAAEEATNSNTAEEAKPDVRQNTANNTEAQQTSQDGDNPLF